MLSVLFLHPTVSAEIFILFFSPIPFRVLPRVAFWSLSVLSYGLGINFARFCIAPRIDFNCFLISSQILLSLFLYSFNLRFINFMSEPFGFFRKKSDFLSLARYPASCSFCRKSNFSLVFCSVPSRGCYYVVQPIRCGIF